MGRHACCPIIRLTPKRIEGEVKTKKGFNHKSMPRNARVLQ
jgi:hypothetical protein